MPRPNRGKNVIALTARIDVVTWSRLTGLAGFYGCGVETLIRERLRELAGYECARNNIVNVAEHIRQYTDKQRRNHGSPPVMQAERFKPVSICACCGDAVDDAGDPLGAVPRDGTKSVPHAGTRSVPRDGTRAGGAAATPASAPAGVGGGGEDPTYFKKTRPPVRFFLYLTNRELVDLYATLDRDPVPVVLPNRPGYVWKEIPKKGSTSAS